MDTQIIQYIRKSSDFIFNINTGEKWNGYFILSGKASMNISISCILGKHADATIRIISMVSGSASVTVHTLQHHMEKESRSNLLVKNIVSENSSFVFDGNIIVDKIADKTDAYQRNENLLLSPDAHVISRPTLEILASDVRCTHAATTGEIPFDELWYLKTRGLSDADAKTMYVQGFMQSALSGLKQDVSESIMHRIMDI
jgi:Fe-S cluster assembly protein SufD